MRKLLAIGALWVAGVQVSLPADEGLTGFLCCNVYTDGESVSDINFGGEGQHLIPLGSPIRVTRLKKNKMQVVVENKNIKFENEYSRDLPIEQFSRRWIVQDDPAAKAKTFPKSIQVAIADGHVMLGMTREQVLMSLGYPASSEVPNLNAKAWTYWCTAKVQYRVRFDEQDRVADVEPWSTSGPCCLRNKGADREPGRQRVIRLSSFPGLAACTTDVGHLLGRYEE